MKTLTDHVAEHWLWQMICDHETKTDVAVCACGHWRSDPQPSVGEAARRWADHAIGSAFNVHPSLEQQSARRVGEEEVARAIHDLGIYIEAGFLGGQNTRLIARTAIALIYGEASDAS